MLCFWHCFFHAGVSASGFLTLVFWRWSFRVWVLSLGGFGLFALAGLQRWAFCVGLLASVGLLAVGVLSRGPEGRGYID